MAFTAAVLMAGAEPGPRLVEFLTTATPPPSWNRAATEAFHRVVAAGGPRSWRFLETTGVLELALPELASALRRRRLDPGLVDPAGVLRFPVLETIRTMHDPAVDPLAAQEIARLEHPERLALAALLLDVVSDEPEPLRTATTALERLGTDDDDASAVSVLISQRSLLTAAAKRLDGLDEESVLRIGAHLAVREQARALYALSVAQQDFEPWERMRLDELYRLVLDGLEHPELTGPQASTRVDARRAEAIALVAGRPLLADRIAIAPRSYILNEDAASIARHAALLHPLPAKGRFRVEVEPEREAGVWRVEVAARDQIGLLATVTGVMEAARLDVIDAVIATWGDRAALQAFRVRTEAVGLAPDRDAIARLLQGALRSPLTAAPVHDAVVGFDDGASPWHTLAEVRATDRRGLLHALAVAFSAAGADVHAARVTTTDEMALDRFDLTTRDGHKLDEETKRAIVAALHDGVSVRARRGRMLPTRT